MKKIALHWQIIIGILAGLLFGFICVQIPGGKTLVVDWIKPFGTIFINLLKLIAVPLIIVSLIKGVSDLKDISQLSKLGFKTIGLYLLTTVLAVSTGLIAVNVIEPGLLISEETRSEMTQTFGDDISLKVEEVHLANQERGPLQPLIDIVPENIFESASANSNMLQVIFFCLILGVAMVMLPFEKIKAFKGVLDAGNEIVLKIVDLIMLSAPFGVFALLAALVVEAPSADIFKALGAYGLTVVIGFVVMTFGVYGVFVRLFGKIKLKEFYKAVSPAQLLGFSTSSSAATLPVTLECVEDNLNVRKEVSSFVIPIGATVNMDGTSLYQGVAAVFIAQVMGNDLSLAQQLTVILTATLASIGTAAVPGAGILMLVIVLESIGVSPAGIALIFAVDRPLDMLRTITNITGDCMVALIVDRTTGSDSHEEQ
ncbi:MAG TPA: dicarboxylate/amino acid:cation symporter [Sphingobacterium sp.]|nr:dicarboxylate/amino acid:cation symporter [Sphingobacterium sp.]